MMLTTVRLPGGGGEGPIMAQTRGTGRLVGVLPVCLLVWGPPRSAVCATPDGQVSPRCMAQVDQDSYIRTD